MGDQARLDVLQVAMQSQEGLARPQEHLEPMLASRRAWVLQEQACLGSLCAYTDSLLHQTRPGVA